jgi:glycosyltransferase involved in cell wall biosynthesis
MRVCFVLHSPALGGAERANLELIDALRKRGVKCFAMLPGSGPLINELKKRDVQFKVFPYRWWTASDTSPLWTRVYRITFNFVMTPLVVRQLKKWNPDIIVTNTITVCTGAFAAKIFNAPHVWYIHEFGYEDHRLIYILGSRISLHLINKLSTACIACSHAVAEKYWRFIPDEKVKVVYYPISFLNPLETSPRLKEFREQCIREGNIRLAIVGTLQEGKGQEDAIRAIGELTRRGIKAHLYVVGKGSPKYKEFLDHLINENHLEDHVTFLGYIPNAIEVMRCVDIVLVCSRMEAFGRVTVEAMRAGKPVIGARSGGTTELIRENFNGLLYTPGNYVELAEKILYLLEHPDIAKEMGANGEKWATEHFSEEKYRREVLAIFERGLQRNELRRAKRSEYLGK